MAALEPVTQNTPLVLAAARSYNYRSGGDDFTTDPIDARMARDHYVAKTYLKHFAGSDGMLRAYRKSDGKRFPCRPDDVCHEWDGDLIGNFLRDPATLAKYRRMFEPAWNPAITELIAGGISPINKLAIAGYWANLLAFTPTCRRLDVAGHDRHVVDYLRARDILTAEAGKTDEQLKRILATLSTGKVKVATRPDAMRAMRVKHLWELTWALYNSSWVVMTNETDTEFLTSDNPVSFDDPGPWRGQPPSLPRYFPLTPRVCLYCVMRAKQARDTEEPDFARPPQGQIRQATIPIRGVRRVNRAIVQCAEDLVFSSDNRSSTAALVAKYARHRVEQDFIEVRTPGSFLLGMRLRVRARTNA
jgi:hypothetical protein